MPVEPRTEVMTDRDLALNLLEWGEKRRELTKLENRIKDTVLHVGKTQTVGDVRASYSGGRRTFNYEGAVRRRFKQDGIPDDLVMEDAAVKAHTETIVRTEWGKVAKVLLIPKDSVSVLSQSSPSVSIKLHVSKPKEEPEAPAKEAK